MQPLNTFIKRFLCAALLLCASAFVFAAYGQQPAPSQTPQTVQTPADALPNDEVLRISTELVQTDVMVFDKQGNFVDNLKPEQFELRVDGKPQTISFFERVTAGSSDEEAQIAAARGVARSSTAASTTPPPRPLDRGRTIFFFIDDLHLSAQNVGRTRKTLLNFIEKEMIQNDQVAITSATGQIGFLQQLTDNKTVLRKAVERLAFRAVAIKDNERPLMTIYQAIEVERNNVDVLSFFIEQMLKDNPGMTRPMAENLIRARSRRLVQQSDLINTNLLVSLSSLIRSTAQLPGRKLVFFISEGFEMNERDSDITNKIRRATDAAARSGTVIYTLDVRGLQSGFEDSFDRAFDQANRLPSASTEIRSTQEPLRTIAANTGGRALLNSNSLDLGIRQTLKETSAYYLLAWRPDNEQQRPNKFHRIEAKIIGRSDLSVRVRNGFFTTDPETVARRGKNDAPVKPQSAAAKTTETELRTAINSIFPKTAVPTSLFAYYTDTQEHGPLLSVIMSVAPEAVTLEMKDGKQTGAIDVGGLVFNEDGKVGATFKDQIRINVAPSEIASALGRGLFYNHQVRIKPGLYQVRVAARDEKSGRTGSASQWIEIPDLAKRALTMSSLLIGGRPAQAAGAQGNAIESPVVISVERRFPHNSKLRFLTEIYNATRGAAANAAPDVAIQVQVFRDDQPVVTTALRKVSTEGLTDLTRIPYGAEILLDNLPAGHYVLRLTAIDRIAKTSASRDIGFEII